MMSDQVSADGNGLSAVTLATGGLIVGAVCVCLFGLSGPMPLTFTTNDALVAGMTTAWVVPVVALGVVSTAIAHTLGICGVARLRPGFASLVGLGEVVFALVSAWVLLGQSISTMQAVGGAVVLLGLAPARTSDRSAKLSAAAWPHGEPIEELAASLPGTKDRHPRENSGRSARSIVS